MVRKDFIYHPVRVFQQLHYDYYILQLKFDFCLFFLGKSHTPVVCKTCHRIILNVVRDSPGKFWICKEKSENFIFSIEWEPCQSA